MKRILSGGLQFFLAWYGISFANPVQIPPAPPLSEIYIVNDNNWAVEVECRKFSLLKRPCTTDTFTLFCSQSSAIPPRNSMQNCVIRELVDSNGIAVLIPQQFPQVKLVKGWYVTLGLKGQSEADTVWQAHIPDTLTEPFSIISSYITKSCCTMIDINFCLGCAERTYVHSICPSIGTFNDSAFGAITGLVIGSDSLPLTNIGVECNNYANYRTDRYGIYRLSNLDNCHTYSLRFTDMYGTSISDTVVGPLSIIMGRTRTVNVRLNYKYPTSVKSSEKIVRSHGNIRLLPSGAGQRIVLSVVESSASKGSIDLFSANGKFIRSLPFVFDKPGTYTINWDGRDDRQMRVGTGTYGCRVQVNGERVCSGFIIK